MLNYCRTNMVWAARTPTYSVFKCRGMDSRKMLSAVTVTTTILQFFCFIFFSQIENPETYLLFQVGVSVLGCLSFQIIN